MANLVPFVDLKTQYVALRPEILAAVQEVFESAAFVLGPDVSAFEEEFAAYCGTKACVSVESGTAALQLALQACRIGSGDEVILPANTYIASALAVSHAGARPVLVDVDDHYHMDLEQAEQAITPRTKALMPVHLYGHAVEMGPVLELAAAYGLRVIEDAAQAHGAMSGGRRVGSIGDIGCFSFYPGKNLGAYGDGGAIVTNDSELEEYVRLARDFGQREKYVHLIKGDNCRLDTVQAAVLRVKLRYLDEWNDARRSAAKRYDDALRALRIEPPPRRAEDNHVYHLYVIEVAERDAALKTLRERGVQCGIHYPTPIHRQPAYRELNLETGTMQRTEGSAARVLSLPMYPELSAEQIDRVICGLEAHLRSLATAAKS